MERESSQNMALLSGKYAKDSGRLAHFAVSRFRKKLESLLDKIQVETVIEAGCGEGYIVENILSPRYPDLQAFDLDMGRAAYLKQNNPAMRVFRGNLHHVPIADNAADLVLCLEVLEHVGEPELSLKELHRITRRYAILSVPNEPFWRIANMLRGAYWSEWGNTPEHINHWSIWSFKRFVSRYFNILETATPVTWTFILAEKRQPPG